jgi:hypothetical protein
MVESMPDCPRDEMRLQGTNPILAALAAESNIMRAEKQLNVS